MAAYPSIKFSYPVTEHPPKYQTLRTDMESGYVQTRAKTTLAPRRYEVQHVNIPGADVATWVTFWNARKGGSEAFDFTDPRTGSTVSVRFSDDNAPVITRVGFDTYSITPIMLEEAL